MRSTESAVAVHDHMVRAERLQGERAAGKRDESDFWRDRVGRFRPPAEPDVDDQAVLDELTGLIDAQDRVIDVGAGAGRFAIPLAARCGEVVAVEPSPAMRGALEEARQARGIRNLIIVPQRWEEAEVVPAALVFTAHVTYTAPAIEPFVRKLDRSATKHAAVVAFALPPWSAVGPFWRAVHGEERLRLPGLNEVLAVVRELGAEPELVPLPPRRVRPYASRDDALATLRQHLYVPPDTPADLRLREAIDALTEERAGGLWPREAEPLDQSLIRWKAKSFR